MINSITIFIVILTASVSILAFYSPALFSAFRLNPYDIVHRKQYYRVLTHAFLHADWAHLIVNMIVLISFGNTLEYYFHQLSFLGIIKYPGLIYIGFYVLAIILSSVNTIRKQKDNAWYNAVGASGAVSAAVFATIFFAPWEKLYLYAFLPIPGIIFGILYLAYSQYASRKGTDNINHEAHFWGAVFGFIFPILLDYKLFLVFIQSLINY